MKKIIIFLLILFPSNIRALPVSQNRAKEIATEFFNRRVQTRTEVSDVVVKLVGQSQLRNSNVPPQYYVFDNTQGGFVIISGDDCVQPVLGYSSEGRFQEDALPDNLAWWLSELSAGIDYLRKNGIQSTEDIKSLWKDSDQCLATRGTKADAMRLLQTAQWNQEAPYNEKCPIIDGQKTYTGCVPTAMAILLRYYQWPQYGQGILDGYEYEDETGVRRSVPGLALNHYYDWSNMPLKYSYSSWTTTQTDAVAQLMLDCGVMVCAHYNVIGSSGTTAYTEAVIRALIEYMQFDASAVWLHKNTVPTKTWCESMIENIDRYGPIFYSGSNLSSAGHAFVVDGYDSAGNFHINWGWGGAYNGFFAFPDFRNYPLQHEMLLKLKKNENGKAVEMIALGCKDYGLRLADEQEVVVNKPFDVQIERVFNAGLTPFSGRIAIATVDKTDALKEILTVCLDCAELKSGFGYSDISRTCKVTRKIEIGDRIKLFYQSDNDDNWHPVLCDTDVYGEIPIADRYFIDEATSVEYFVERRTIEIRTKQGVVWQLLCDDTGNSVSKGVSFDNGCLLIDTSFLEPGSYSLKLSKEEDQKILTFIIGKK